MWPAGETRQSQGEREGKKMGRGLEGVEGGGVCLGRSSWKPAGKLHV